MKKINPKSTIPIFLLLVLTFKSPAQFTSASQADGAVGTNAAPFNLSNDILNVSGTTYKVSVWSDANNDARLAWYVDNGSVYTGNKKIGNGINTGGLNDVYYADVTLTQDGGTVYAIIAFYVGSTQTGYTAAPSWFIQDYYWDANYPSPDFVYDSYAVPAFTSGSHSFNFTINIDADQAGNFISVFDDAGTGSVYAISGYIYGGAMYMNNSSAAVSINTGSFPDVCLYNDGMNPDVAHISYIDNNGDLTVEDHDLSNLATATISPIVQLTPESPPNGAGYYFYYPKIACPTNGNPSYSTDWTVVVYEDDHLGTNTVYGYNQNGVNYNPAIVYNDGTNAPYQDLAAVPNYYPVVTYNDQYPNDNSIWVGWTMDNSSGYYNGAGAQQYSYPIVLQCDGYGNPITNYLEVPFSLSADVYLLALSGRNVSSTVFMTYFNVDGYNDVNYKDDAYNASSLKLMQGTENDAFSTLTSQNIFEDRATGLLTLKLFEMNGKELINKNGTYEELNRCLVSYLINHNSTSILVAQLISEDGKYYKSKKIFKQ